MAATVGHLCNILGTIVIATAKIECSFEMGK